MERDSTPVPGQPQWHPALPRWGGAGSSRHSRTSSGSPAAADRRADEAAAARLAPFFFSRLAGHGSSSGSTSNPLRRHTSAVCTSARSDRL